MDVLTRDRAEKLEREILESFEEDYVGLWEIVRDVEEELVSDVERDDPATVRKVTVSLVRDMLARGLIRPGRPLNGGRFEPWSLESGVAADKIDSEWRESGPPSIESAWFEITSSGKAYLSSLA